MVTIGAIIGLYFASGKSGGNNNTSGLTLSKPVSAEDWRRNAPDNAKAILVEYGDFQCPACGAYESMLDRLQSEFNGQLQFVYREFPLTQVHQNAQLAAQAAEAAGLQGKFWEMHDKLYATQRDWSDQPNSQALSLFKSYAQSLGLNVPKFSSDINSSAVTTKIANDVSSGNLSGIQGTPTFFLNGKDAGYPQNYDEFKAEVQKALQ
jgi:protein-disulfide isomerase